MQIFYSKNLDVRYHTDVLIAGGGPSGVAAAVMCAEVQKFIGGSVLLLEQSGTFGGSSTLAGVPELMNFDDGKNFLANGFGQKVYTALYGECPLDRSWQNVRTQRLKLLYDKIMTESDADFHFYSRIVDVIVSDKRVTHAIVSSPEGIYAIETGIIIDCTGSGTVCALAGCDYDYGDENGVPMSSTLCSLWGGVDFIKKDTDGKYLGKAIQDGIFSQYDTLLPGIKPTYPELGVGGGNVGHCFGVKDIETESVTQAMIDGRRRLEEYRTFYRNYVPGCENAELIDSANYLGIRESRRIRCEETLVLDDFFDQTPKPNEIGRYSYPIDIHPMTADNKGMSDFNRHVSCRHSPGESYSIPYGCLVPKDIRNMLVAGRCIGADHSMQASVRVIPGCYITGQAAGIAAAVCIRDNTDVRNADIAEVQKLLKEVCQDPQERSISTV